MGEIYRPGIQKKINSTSIFHENNALSPNNRFVDRNCTNSTEFVEERYPEANCIKSPQIFK